ncbi:MAG TPA: HEAT repeat domain-containing protein [Clostridia bacterium]|nr:HEAT repeat domain-containing protein [Clostridia bacterium]
MMSKRGRLALAVLLVALVSVVVCQMWPTREPVYQGKRLTAWLSQYMANHWVAAKQNNELDKQAQAAIRQIGTNAIPSLLRMLRAKDSALTLKMMSLAQYQHIIRIGPVPAKAWNWTATAGFQVLGEEAQSAVPALMDIINQNITPASRASAIRALGSIGAPAKVAVPLLVQCTTDADGDVHSSSIYALAQIGSEPCLVVPVLAKALRGPVFEAHSNVIRMLERFGPEAKPAVPELLKLLTRPDPFAGSLDKSLVTNALKKIDPQAAAEAGIQ